MHLLIDVAKFVLYKNTQKKMNKEAINKALVELAEKKIELAKTAYSDDSYDEIEDEVHELEDDLIDEFEEEITSILEKVHDEFCSEEDVLHPTAYIANEYKKDKDSFKVALSEGVLVDVDNLGEDEGRIVIVPNPLRVLLNMSNKQVILWN